MVNRRKLYDDFCEAYKNAFPSKSKKTLQCEYNNEWNELKSKHKNINNLQRVIIGRVEFLQNKRMINKSTNILKLLKPTEQGPASSSSNSKSSNLSNLQYPQENDESANEIVNSTDSNETKTCGKKAIYTPSQNESKEKIDDLKS